MDHAKHGAAAIQASNYAEAVEAYTQAIKISSTTPDYWIKRSIAYQRGTPPNNAAALVDAEQGLLHAHKRAKRESIVLAQLRRAIALFGLGRYADAKFVLDIVRRMDPKEKSLPMWENKTAMKLAELDKDDANANVIVKEIPLALVSPTPAVPVPVPVVAQTPSNKIRHDWYQNNDNVVFTLLAKGVPKDKTQIDINERSLAITFPLETGSTYDFSLDPLFAAIDPSRSTTNILSTKIEITLKKVKPGQKWHALESSEPINATAADKPNPTPPTVLDSNTAAPSYPTSSRSGPKNWDKLANDLTTKKPKKEGQDGETTGSSAGAEDDDDWDYEKDDGDGDEVNGFFKKLYSGASDDVRKAMIKSYTESGGTALSTNWGEVSQKPVPVTPPDGMEAKKWS